MPVVVDKKRSPRTNSEHKSRLNGGGSPRNNNQSYRTSTVTSTVYSTNSRLYTDTLHRAKRVTFFPNGDRYHKGVPMAISNMRCRSFENLLSDLTRTLSAEGRLPAGARRVYTIDGVPILNVDELEDRGVYVVTSNEPFKKMDYIGNTTPNGEISLVPSQGRAQQVRKSGSSVESNGMRKSASSMACNGCETEIHYHHEVWPKLITVIRGGRRPRRMVRMLLNKRTAPSFEHVVDDMTDVLKLTSGQVRRVYTTTGQPVVSLQDFYSAEDAFFAFGSEKHGKEDFKLDASESQHLEQLRQRVTESSVEPFTGTPVPRSGRKAMRSSSTRRYPGGLNWEGHIVPHRCYHSHGVKGDFKSTPDLSQINNDPNANVMGDTTDHGRSVDNLMEMAPYNHQPLLDKPMGDENEQFVSSLKLNVHAVVHINLAPENPPEIPPLPAAEEEPTGGGDGSLPEIDNIMLDKYEICEKIGEGKIAVVNRCVERETGNEFAMKIIDKAKCNDDLLMLSEITILKNIRHPNIVLLVEEWDGQNEMYMVMELVNSGNLFEAIQLNMVYTERDASSMIYNLCSALCYLHEMNIVHRDVKPENLLVCCFEDGSKALKLGDFSLAMKVDRPIYTVCGSPTYVAPEVLTETGYGLKIDVWSAGVIAYILLCGLPPFQSESSDLQDLFHKIVYDEIVYPREYFNKISNAATDVIEHMLDRDVANRYTALETLSHEWLANEDLFDNSEDINPNVRENLAKNFHQDILTTGSSGGNVIAKTGLDREYFLGLSSRADDLGSTNLIDI